MERGSIAKANNRGERGQPWRVPLESGKYWEHKKFVLTLATGAVYKRRIHDVKEGPKPNLSNIVNK